MKNVLNFSILARSESERRVENIIVDDLDDYAERRFVIPTLVTTNHRTTRGVVA